MKRLLLLMGVLLSLGGRPLPPLTITANPAVSFEPATVEIRIHIVPDAHNRYLGWLCDSGGYGTAESELNIDGEDGPVNVTKRLRDVPAGTYDCLVQVWRDDQRVIAAKTSFQVKSIG